jgi:N-acetylglutamate synthase
MNTTHDIETAGFASWPCLEEELFLGWHLRFAEGFTKRANSVNAGAHAEVLADAELDLIEAQYHQRHLPTIFRLCSAPAVSGIDSLLAARGYRVVDPSLVMTCPLDSRNRSDAAPDSLAAEEWLEKYHAISGKSKAQQEAHLQLLERMPETRAFVASLHEGQALACGIGVLSQHYLGLFEIATRATHRRQGLASDLCRQLLSWGRGQGAHTAFLQVEANNHGAIRIYENLGFQRCYDYWYRVAGQEGA